MPRRAAGGRVAPADPWRDSVLTKRSGLDTHRQKRLLLLGFTFFNEALQDPIYE
jgi:hypothetical protein